MADTAATTLRGVIKGRPPRLERIFDTCDPPLFFVTFGTLHRQKLSSLQAAHQAFREYAANAKDYDVAVGRYVIMPDHVHLFVGGGHEFDLGRWVSVEIDRV